MFFQFQLIFAPTGTLCLMLFAPTNLQTHDVAHQVRYNLFLIWDPFNKAYRTTCSRASDKEKLSKVKKKSLEKRIYDNLTFIQRAATKPVGQRNKSNCNYFLEVYT